MASQSGIFNQIQVNEFLHRSMSAEITIGWLTARIYHQFTTETHFIETHSFVLVLFTLISAKWSILS